MSYVVKTYMHVPAADSSFIHEADAMLEKHERNKRQPQNTHCIEYVDTTTSVKTEAEKKEYASEDIINFSDFPKIHCPFIRKEFDVNIDQWKKHGREYKLRSPSAYLVIDQINPGYEWVFEDPSTVAIEKLDGTNVKLVCEAGKILLIMNRENIIHPLQTSNKGKGFLVSGIFQAIEKGYVEDFGAQFGEVIGPKLQGNPYKLDHHLWYPFKRAVKHLLYKSFHKYDRTFDNWSFWFQNGLNSLFYNKRRKPEQLPIFAEGIVFYNFKRKDKGLPYMAKLRRDMFEWFYSDDIEVIGYSKKG